MSRTLSTIAPPPPKKEISDLPTLNSSSVMQAKYVWGAVWGKSDKNSLRGNLSFPFAPTSAQPGHRTNKETWKRRGWESTVLKGNFEYSIWVHYFEYSIKGKFWGSERFFSCSFRPKETEFLVMIIRGSIETLPIEVLEEVTTTLHWRKFKDLKFPSLAGFLLSRRPRCCICCFCLSPVGGSVCVCWSSSTCLRWRIAQLDCVCQC